MPFLRARRATERNSLTHATAADEASCSTISSHVEPAAPLRLQSPPSTETAPRNARQSQRQASMAASAVLEEEAREERGARAKASGATREKARAAAWVHCESWESTVLGEIVFF